MAENDNAFMLELLKSIQANITRLETKFDDRMDRLEQRLEAVERRLTASVHFEQSLLGHLASIHASIDNMRADLSAMDRRLTALEAR